MANRKFEPPKELDSLCVKFARHVHERAKRCRAHCGTLELADLVERALVYVLDKDADLRAQEREVTTIFAKSGHRQSVKWVSPAEKTGGAP